MSTMKDDLRVALFNDLACKLARAKAKFTWEENMLCVEGNERGVAYRLMVFKDSGDVYAHVLGSGFDMVYKLKIDEFTDISIQRDKLQDFQYLHVYTPDSTFDVRLSIID